MNFALENKKFAKIALFLAAIPFLWLGAFGLLRHSGEMRSGLTTSGCLFDGQSEVCAMNISEHVGLWQNMFTGLPEQVSGAMLLLFAAVLFFLASTLFAGNDRQLVRSQIYIKKHKQWAFLDFLQEAFSSGVLNPKIYSSVAI